MAYKKKTYGRRRRRYHQATKKRGRVYGDAAFQMWKDVKYLKSVINVEQKWHDTATAANTTEAFQKVSLNLINQGDTAQTRDGNSVKISKFIVNGSLTHNASGNASQTIRLLVACRVQNPTTNSGIAMNDIFQGNPTGAGAVLAFYNKTSMKGYRILLDKKFTVNTDYPTKYFKFYLPSQWHCRFNASTPSADDVPNNICQLVHVGDQVSANYPALNFNTRMVYIDN